jgi:hypothetical protein
VSGKSANGYNEKVEMIPPFNEHGYLPASVHPASFDEIEARLGRESELGRVQVESL